MRINESKNFQFNSLIYMPPEMFSFQEYNCYTDIWDLGIVLYELVMLEKPFQGIDCDEVKNNIPYSSGYRPPLIPYQRPQNVGGAYILKNSFFKFIFFSIFF